MNTGNDGLPTLLEPEPNIQPDNVLSDDVSKLDVIENDMFPAGESDGGLGPVLGGVDYQMPPHAEMIGAFAVFALVAAVCFINRRKIVGYLLEGQKGPRRRNYQYSRLSDAWTVYSIVI